ncbi:ATP-binding protein [Streptomyces bicolor]|uniref:ATP-binding protein n=1 Tax=Streptomyces bicolor TaxID=66874 RepID=UPI0009981176
MARGFLSVIAPTDVAEAEAVLIVVSELVTNAAVHAGGVTGFELRADPGTVTVSVEDASPDPPRPRRSKRTAEWEPGGFGWPLTQELSADVDVCTGPGGEDRAGCSASGALTSGNSTAAPPRSRTRMGPMGRRRSRSAHPPGHESGDAG